MAISRFNDGGNKVKTKEELLEHLKEYKGILVEPMISYLNSLIDLEFSVIKEYISDSDRKVLSELEVYRQIAIYNIYNRTQNLFNQQKGEFSIVGNKNRGERLSISARLNDRSVRLFDFDYREIHSNGWDLPKVPSGFKTLNIGDVSLFQTLESKELREAELDRVLSTLEVLYGKKNPYPSRVGVVGGPGVTWGFEHAKKIQEYEEKFKQLDSKKELSDEDKREIEITRQIHDLLLEDFGLTSESFGSDANQYFDSLGKEKTELEKTLVKNMPNLTIKNHIRYI